MDETERLVHKFAAVLPHLNASQRRLLLATEAYALGHGGVTQVARAAGVSRTTLYKALHEAGLGAPGGPSGQRPGEERKPTRDRDPAVLRALEALIMMESAGSFLVPLRWTCQSTLRLAAALRQRGYPVSKRTVRALLHGTGYRLHPSHLGRAAGGPATLVAQFRVLATHLAMFLTQPFPVLVVHTTTTRLHKPGALDDATPLEWIAQSSRSRTADGLTDRIRPLPSPFVAVCVSSWWQSVRTGAPLAASLLCCVDDGLLHHRRLQAWRQIFATCAQLTGLRVTVCHVPPSTHKWLGIQRRWAYCEVQADMEQALCHTVHLSLLGDASRPLSTSPIPEHPAWDNPSQGGRTDARNTLVRLVPHAVHGEWNYTLVPTLVTGKV